MTKKKNWITTEYLARVVATKNEFYVNLLGNRSKCEELLQKKLRRSRDGMERLTPELAGEILL